MKRYNLFIFVFVAAFLLSILFSLGVLSQIHLSLSDGLYGGLSPREDIIILEIDDKSMQEIGRWPWDREVFAELFDKVDNAKVVGVDVAFFEDSDEYNDALLIQSVENNGRVIVPVEYTKYGRDGDKIVGKEALVPIDGLEEAALDVGYINVITDRDGVSRAANLDVKGEYESFAAATYRAYMGKEYDKKETRFLINFVGKPFSFNHYSISDVIKGKVDKEIFEDKMVLVGATSPDLHDDYFVPTSYGKAMPGVEIHANTLQTMINDKRLSYAPAWLTIFLIFIATFLSSFFAYRLNSWIATGLSVVVLFIYILIAIFAFGKGLILNLFYIPSAFIIGNFTTIIYSYITEKKEKKQVLNAFGKYVSPDLIKEIMKAPEGLKLGGDKREITLLFSDIRGFTTLSESMKPEELVHLLNEYLSEMTDLVLENKGLVDKFIGDAVMAFWGAPLKEKDHASLACRTAVQMKDKLAELNSRWMKQGRPELKIGIGLNTGDAVVGNMGSEQRFDYTAMGDNVNLASRLEGVTKQYGVNIIISESTKKKIHGFKVRELDYVAVKGKKEPIMIYELMGETLTEKQEMIKEHYEKGLHHYKKREWNEAIAEFEKIEDIDYSAKNFIQRCQDYKKDDPGKDWDGVYRLTSK